MKRLFIGIPVFSETTRKMVELWQSDPELNLNRLAWTKYQNWHVTLVFLGATPEAAVARLSKIIEEAFDHCLAYTTTLKGTGVFPGKGKPNVLWIGLDNLQPLMTAYQKLTALLRGYNFTPDDKPLKAHLTIARVKSLSAPGTFHTLLQKHHDTLFGSVTIDRVILYESISSSGGVNYLPLYEKYLSKGEV